MQHSGPGVPRLRQGLGGLAPVFPRHHGMRRIRPIPGGFMPYQL